MFNPSEFLDLHMGMNTAGKVIRRLVKDQGGVFNEDGKHKKRKVWYLDTRKDEIKNNNFLLRVREEKEDDYKITLKNRHSDRYMAALYDLSKPLKTNNMKLDEFKFEEDIMPKFVSKFSASADLRTNDKPKLYTFEDILSLYPNLSDLGIASEDKLVKVNEFQVKEISCDLGNLVFGNDNNKAKLQLSLWYLSDKSPAIVEFDIDLNAKIFSFDGSEILEEFPSSLLIEIHKFYMALQDEEIVDRTSPSTKTDYAYRFGRT